MLTAYYSKGCDSEKMFSGLEIGKKAGFKEHLNQYDVIQKNTIRILKRSKNGMMDIY